ncbi:hypothetical protein [Halosimplex sp. J119]
MESESIEWEQIPAETVTAPIVRECPSFEVKLEHPGLDPSGRGDRFFPDAVPYELDETARTFYWRPALAAESAEPDDWDLVCATTHELAGLDGFPAAVPAVATDGEDGTTVVVGGTVAGDSTTSRVRSYATPTVSLDGLSDDAVAITAEGDEYQVSRGDRRCIRLAERRVEPVAEDGGQTTVMPELVVRYPGRRELHHPAPGASYRLFPSFGLDLDDVPRPLAVPTAAGELDDEALARKLGVDLSQRPYPERVLWQALAYTAFDPHAETTAALTQLETGHIVVQAGNF